MMNGETVYLARMDGYDEEALYRTLGDFITREQRCGHLLKKGVRILLKPNLLIGKVANACVTTHPIFVRAVARLFIDAGADVLLGDSPAIGSARHVARKAGILDSLADLPVRIIEFTSGYRGIIPTDQRFRDIELASILSEVEGVINLPKVKTHGQMVMTLAVKNLFGLVVGLRKQQWHLQAGRHHDNFADMLVQIADLVRPALTLVDGIMGMEGNGPSAGTPRQLGFVVAGCDPVAIDRIILECLGVKPQVVMTMNSAQRLGVGQPDLLKISVIGSTIEECHVADFALPGLQSVVGNRLPPFLVNRLKRWLTDLPRINNDMCTRCETCLRQCPAEALSLHTNATSSKVVLDPDRCISCFCCQEVCPEAAMHVHTALSSRIFKVFGLR